MPDLEDTFAATVKRRLTTRKAYAQAKNISEKTVDKWIATGVLRAIRFDNSAVLIDTEGAHDPPLAA
jgi:hypothetical protein